MPRKPAATPRRKAAARPIRGTLVNLRSSLADMTWSLSPRDIGPETAIRVSSILGVVRWISQAVAVMPLQIMRTLPDGRKEDAAIPCSYTLRKRPNPWQSAYDFWQLVSYWTALYGNAYARVLPGPRGFCSELRPMHPSRVKVERASDYSLTYKFWSDRGAWEPVPASEVLHWRWLSNNGVVGMAPAELCGTSIALARQLDIAATAFWQNSARPDVVLETQEKIPQEAVDALREQIRTLYGGAANRGSAAVLPRKTKLVPIESNSMEANQFQELRDAILPDVCRCWGVPSTLLGDARMAKYSTVEQEHLSAQVWCLLPWQKRMEGPVDMLLQPVYGEDVYAKLDNRGLLRGDTAARSSLYQTLWNMGAITPNEIRDREDLPLLEDPAANETFVQLGFSTLAAAAAAQAGAAGGDPPASDPTDDTPADDTPVDTTVDSETDPLAAAASGAALASTALNGAQVAALLDVLNQIAAGTIDKDAAVALITAAFPTITEALASQMVDGTNPAQPGGQNDAT
jgi:HK97 family phage portal protein